MTERANSSLETMGRIKCFFDLMTENEEVLIRQAEAGDCISQNLLEGISHYKNDLDIISKALPPVSEKEYSYNEADERIQTEKIGMRAENIEGVGRAFYYQYNDRYATSLSINYDSKYKLIFWKNPTGVNKVCIQRFNPENSIQLSSFEFSFNSNMENRLFDVELTLLPPVHTNSEVYAFDIDRICGSSVIESTNRLYDSRSAEKAQ